MTTDLTNAMALMSAWLDDDQAAIDAIGTSVDLADLTTELFFLALSFGRQLAHEDDDALRFGLSHVLTRSLTGEDHDPR